jgi:DNA processing protein
VREALRVVSAPAVAEATPRRAFSLLEEKSTIGATFAGSCRYIYVTSISLPPDDPAYPPALADLGTSGRPPPTLWIRGTLPVQPAVAIVGTRQASDAALAFARTLAAELAAQGIAVWSGGAAGVDAAAHEGALDAGGVTVLVAGGGLDRPYPPQHRGLFERVVAAGGALVARVPDGTPPMAPLFLLRNEVLAALTLATVVVEAGLESGARSTVAAARRLGRHVCVVPHPPWDERGAGCALELVKGAVPVVSSAEVLATLGRPPPPRRLPARRGRRRAPEATLPLPALPVDLGPVETAVLHALGERPAHQDEVCERTELGAPGVLGALLALTLGEVVVEGPAGFFRRA